jgi:hypothetical protein
MRRRRISALHSWLTGTLLTSLVLAGCSSYSGKKLGVDEDTKKEIAPTGLPYSLTRPEFTLSRSPPADGAKKATYTLAVAYENDPSQRYDIRISPSLFADATLTVKFTTVGTIASTTGGITDLIGPTIMALGSFAKDVIAASATGAFDQDALRTIAIDKMNEVSECKAHSVVPTAPIPYVESKPTVPQRTVADEMANRIRGFKSDDEFVEKFHYLTSDEKLCLQAVVRAANNVQDSELKAAQNDWKKAHEDYKSAKPADSDFLMKVAKAYGDGDLTVIMAISRANVEAFKTGSQADKQLAAARQPVLATSETALRLIAESALSTRLESIFTSSDSAWLARHVLFLEREAARIELARIRQPNIAQTSSKEVSDYIDLLQASRARALGVLDLYERSLTLAKFLRQIERKTEHGASAPATAEFALARLELDTVLTQIEARRTKVVAAAAPPAAPTIAAVKAEPVAVVDKKVIADSKVEGWTETSAG